MRPASDPSSEHLRRARARIGSMLRDKWRLDALLGNGGMAAVYAATHRNGKRAAIKILHPELSTMEDIRSRFLREGYLANKVAHPGAVSVLDDDVAEDGSVFIVMELLDGATVEACADDRRGGRFDVAETLGVAEHLLDVLASAHDQGIIHRDIKPENVFITRSGELKVLDFGIARLRETESASRLTATGAMLGTPAFMAPEQASGRWDDVDSRTDLWAVGAVMFAMLTGEPVHKAETVQLLIIEAILKQAPKLATKRPDIQPHVAAIVDRALAFNREERFQTAREMQSAIREIEMDLPAKHDRSGWRTLASARSPSLSMGRDPMTSDTSEIPVRAAVGTTTQGVISSIPRKRRRPRGTAAIALSGVALAIAIVLGARLLFGTHPKVATTPPPGEEVAPANTVEAAESAHVQNAAATPTETVTATPANTSGTASRSNAGAQSPHGPVSSSAAPRGSAAPAKKHDDGF